jgi:hypothetical protein
LNNSEAFYYPNLKKWIKLISVTGGTQMMIQAFGLISGLLIIRLMPIKEYAWYTIANTMLGTLTLLSDGGISIGVMAEGGKVWDNNNQLATIVSTGMKLRMKFAIISLIVSIPILTYLLLKQGASFFTCVFIVVGLIPAFYSALSDNLLEIPLKLRQVIVPLQKNQLAAAFFRLTLSTASLFFFPFTAVALIANGIPRIWANFKLKQINKDIIGVLPPIEDEEVRKSIYNVVKRSLPAMIYYCVSGQITIWLVSIFGNNTSVASLGGIGRILVIFTVITAILSNLIIPRFAKLPSNTKTLMAFFIKVNIVLLVFSLVVSLFVFLFSKQILYILGANYSSLTFPLVISAIAGCISLLGSNALSLCLSRGWVINPIISISLSILAFVIGVLTFDVHTIVGITKLNIVIALNQLITYTTYCIIKMKRLI